MLDTESYTSLTKALQKKDPRESHDLYNKLPRDSDQPEISQSHINYFNSLFFRHHVWDKVMIHLLHGHGNLPDNAVLLGETKDNQRVARFAALDNIDLANIHGHVFILTQHGFHPYEYQQGPMPDLSDIDSGFLPEFTKYLISNNLVNLVGLEIVDPSLWFPHTAGVLTNDGVILLMEIINSHGTVVAHASSLSGYTASRQTGWLFGVQNGKPCVRGQIRHGTEKGKPHRDFVQGPIRRTAELG